MSRTEWRLPEIPEQTLTPTPDNPLSEIKPGTRAYGIHITRVSPMSPDPTGQRDDAVWEGGCNCTRQLDGSDVGAISAASLRIGYVRSCGCRCWEGATELGRPGPLTHRRTIVRGRDPERLMIRAMLLEAGHGLDLQMDDPNQEGCWTSLTRIALAYGLDPDAFVRRFPRTSRWPGEGNRVLGGDILEMVRSEIDLALSGDEPAHVYDRQKGEDAGVSYNTWLNRRRSPNFDQASLYGTPAVGIGSRKGKVSVARKAAMERGVPQFDAERGAAAGVSYQAWYARVTRNWPPEKWYAPTHSVRLGRPSTRGLHRVATTAATPAPTPTPTPAPAADPSARLRAACLAVEQMLRLHAQLQTPIAKEWQDSPLSACFACSEGWAEGLLLDTPDPSRPLGPDNWTWTNPES